MQEQAMDQERIALVADVVSAYVSNNRLGVDALPGLISTVSRQFGVLGSPQMEEAPKHEPAVSIKKSVTQDFIISLIDGKPYKALRRHLSQHNLTPAEYRERYGLREDYPMVAPAYSMQRSALAKKLGLGRVNRPDGGVSSLPASQIETPPVAQSTGKSNTKTTETNGKSKPKAAEVNDASASKPTESATQNGAAPKDGAVEQAKTKTPKAAKTTEPKDGVVAKEAKAPKAKAKTKEAAPAPAEKPMRRVRRNEASAQPAA